MCTSSTIPFCVSCVPCLCLMPGGELFDYVYKLDHLPEVEAAYYTQQLASFLAYAHSKLIIHRWVCPVGGLYCERPCSVRLQTAHTHDEVWAVLWEMTMPCSCWRGPYPAVWDRLCTCA